MELLVNPKNTIAQRNTWDHSKPKKHNHLEKIHGIVATPKTQSLRKTHGIIEAQKTNTKKITTEHD